MTITEDIVFCANRDDIICPICLDFPHNCVLLQCSSYEKGCRAFVCDTDYLHSNCLERFKEANGMLSSGSQSPKSVENLEISDPKEETKPACPLCRGEVTGWIVIDKARQHFDPKHRRCEAEKCTFTGTYLELQKHARLVHPNVRPCKIDSARQLDWENFQQSTEIIDVLSTIHSEIPNGVILGDYVIEYGNGNNSGDDFDDFQGNKRNWISSCIFYKLFRGFRRSRNKRRQRVNDNVRSQPGRLSWSNNPEEDSVSSVEFADYGDDEADGGFASAMRHSRRRAGQESSTNYNSRFYDN